MTALRDNHSTYLAEPAKAIFHHRALILRYGAVQQTAQIAAARDLALFVSTITVSSGHRLLEDLAVTWRLMQRVA